MKEKFIVRACWEDDKPLHYYGHVVRDELVKNTPNEFSVKTKKDGVITFKKKKGEVNYEILKRVLIED